MNSSKQTESQDLVQQLKKDAQQWNPSPSQAHKERTLQAIREEFIAPPARKVIAFPVFSPTWATIAALLVLSVGFLLYQSNQPKQEKMPIALSPLQLEKDLQILTDFSTIPSSADTSLSLLADPVIDELHAIVEDLETTFFVILDIVEAS